MVGTTQQFRLYTLLPLLVSCTEVRPGLELTRDLYISLWGRRRWRMTLTKGELYV